jgi:hypothetical protein
VLAESAYAMLIQARETVTVIVRFMDVVE